MYRVSQIRYISTSSKPLLHDILPSKKVISRLLFDFDAKHNFSNYLPVIESIYDENPKIPSKFKGNDLLLFQRVLANIRKQTHTIHPLLLSLENSLIEAAAERGSRDAISILSFMALNDVNNKEGFSEEDKLTAKNYMKELMELEHPLTFKLAADRELKQANSNQLQQDEDEISISSLNDKSSEKLSRAIALYNHFLQLDPNSTISASAHRSLGLIYFKLQNLTESAKHFELSINLAPILDNAQSHFFLGLLNEQDPLKSRYHFQMSATQGFKESFPNLGYLELNVFNDLQKAKEWFKLGSEISINECIVGLFDVYIRETNWKSANNVLEKVKDNTQIMAIFNSVRKDTIALLKQKIKLPDEEPKMTVNNSHVDDKSRWDV